MNLILSFIHPSKPSRQVGPVTSVRIDAESMHDGTGGKLIARHREHHWEVEGERFFRVDMTTRVRIHFERARPAADASTKSRSFGPYERLSAVDGIAYADDRVFAFVDARVGDWYCYGDGRHWSVMVVADASRRAAKDTLRAVMSCAVPRRGDRALGRRQASIPWSSAIHTRPSRNICRRTEYARSEPCVGRDLGMPS